MGVSRSLDEFAAKLFHYGQINSRDQINAMRRSRDRMETALDNAATRLAGADHTLSRVGRATGFGTRAGGHLVVRVESLSLNETLFRARGPWQIKDSSVSGGGTKAHQVDPRPDRNPRPLSPAKKYQPSLRGTDGEFSQGAWVGGAPRSPAWRNAVQSTQPKIIELHTHEFRSSLREAF